MFRLCSNSTIDIPYVLLYALSSIMVVTCGRTIVIIVFLHITSALRNGIGGLYQHTKVCVLIISLSTMYSICISSSLIHSSPTCRLSPRPFPLVFPWQRAPSSSHSCTHIGSPMSNESNIIVEGHTMWYAIDIHTRSGKNSSIPGVNIQGMIHYLWSHFEIYYLSASTPPITAIPISFYVS